MQKSIGEIAKPQKVLQRAYKSRSLRRTGALLKIGPVRGDQRFAAVRQEEHELQSGWHAHLPEDVQRLSFKWMIRTRNGDAFGEVLMMGSVS